MRKPAFLLSILTLAIAFFSITAFADTEKYPKPTGYVSDFAKVLPPEVKMNIERKLQAYNEQTSIEIAVVTISKLTQATDFDEAQKIGEDWGVGKRGKDNGLILLFSMKERKIRIHPGYGLEGVMTDAKASVIINKLVPEMRKSISGGIEKFVDEVIKELGEKTTEEGKQDAKSKFWLIVIIILIVIIAIVPFILILLWCYVMW